MTQWFGEPWPRPDFRAPICENDADRIETPVGALCRLCGELIDEDDQGTAMPFMRTLSDRERALLDDDDDPVDATFGGMVYDHKECGLRSVLGCYGQLTGQGHSHDVPYRQDALKVQEWLQQHGTWSI